MPLAVIHGLVTVSTPGPVQNTSEYGAVTSARLLGQNYRNRKYSKVRNYVLDKHSFYNPNNGRSSLLIAHTLNTSNRLAARASRSSVRQPRGCHCNWLWPFVMLRATPQLSSALPRPAFGSCQIHPADTYLMGRRRKCSRKRTRTPSGVCSVDRNIRAAPARIMIKDRL